MRRLAILPVFALVVLLSGCFGGGPLSALGGGGLPDGLPAGVSDVLIDGTVLPTSGYNPAEEGVSPGYGYVYVDPGAADDAALEAKVAEANSKLEEAGFLLASTPDGTEYSGTRWVNESLALTVRGVTKEQAASNFTSENAYVEYQVETNSIPMDVYEELSELSEFAPGIKTNQFSENEWSVARLATFPGTSEADCPAAYATTEEAVAEFGITPETKAYDWFSAYVIYKYSSPSGTELEVYCGGDTDANGAEIGVEVAISINQRNG